VPIPELLGLFHRLWVTHVMGASSPHAAVHVDGLPGAPRRVEGFPNGDRNRMQFHLLPPTICLQLDLNEAAFGSKSFDFIGAP
jgi:hypothetical protein